MTKTFSSKTNAIDKSIGFDFQYYYFLDAILNIKSGQSVGLEVKDDIHTQLNSERQILIQLKHTVQTSAGGAPKALTELDTDLWKTISNWAQIISDKSDGREKKEDQLIFVEKTVFLLVSNKSENNDNAFIQILNTFQKDESKYKVVKDLLELLSKKTQNKDIKDYFSNISKLDDEVLKVFMCSIKFELNENDIIDRVKRSILSKVILQARVDEVFARLDSNLRADNFISARAGIPIVISFDDFIQKYGKVFSDVRSKKLTRHKFAPIIPQNLEHQTFIRQLLEIMDFEVGDKDLIIQYTTQKVMLAQHLEKWVQDGLLTTDEVDQLHDDAQTMWRNHFRQAYRFSQTMSELKKQENALNILDNLRKSTVSIDKEALDISLSNGEYYYLSDLPVLGWHHEWEKKFK